MFFFISFELPFVNKTHSSTIMSKKYFLQRLIASCEEAMNNTNKTTEKEKQFSHNSIFYEYNFKFYVASLKNGIIYEHYRFG